MEPKRDSAPAGQEPGAASRSSGSFVPTRKSEDRLTQQLGQVEQALNVSLVPPSAGNGAALTSSHLMLTDAEVRDHHRVRYDAMRSVLPYLKKGELLPEDIKERFSHQIRLLNNLELYVSNHREGKDGRLRAPQVEVMSDIAAALGSGEVSGYIKLPTGFGKTRIFAALTEAADVKTLVLVPKSLLCNQTVEQFNKLAPNLTVCERHGSRDDGDGKIVVSTYQYFLEASKDGRIDPRAFDLVILDEGHKALGEATQEALARIPTTVPSIAFTATPSYSDKKSLEALMGDCWHEVSLREGIRLGALAPATVVLAKTSIDVGSVTVVGQGYDQAELVQAVKKAGLSKSALQLYQKAFAGRSAIGFCCGVAHANEAAQVFREAGVKAVALSGSTPDNERDQAIADFKDGKIQVLFSADLLIEGFDAANASVCLNMAPTASIVSAEQRGGRVLRLDPHSPSKYGVIVEFLLSDERRSVPQIFFSDILGGVVCPPGNEVSDETKKAMEEQQSILKSLSIEGLELKVEAAEILSITRAVQPDTELSIAPEGWLTTAGVAKEIGKTETIVHCAIKNLGAQKTSGLMGRFSSPETGRSVIMYNPAIVPLIKNYRRDALIEAGWKKRGEIAVLLHRNESIVAEALAKIVEEKPELVSFGTTTGTRKSSVLYHPSVLDILRADTSQVQRLWPRVSIAEVERDVRLPKIVIEDAFRKLSQEYPHDLSDGRWKPEFKARLEQRLKDEYIGSFLDDRGKVTVRSLTAYLEVDASEFTAIRNKLVAQNPGARSWTLDSEISMTPQVAAAMRQHILVRMQKPATWEASVHHNRFVSTSPLPPGVFNKCPEIWAQDFIIPGNTGKSLYYHPRLIRLIRKVEELNAQKRVELGQGSKS
jgi:superfamily II DNA or RNA helicase